MIEAERFRKVDRIFQSALDLDPQERKTYISEACEWDEVLISEIEQLFVSDEENYSLLDNSAFDMAAPLLAHDTPALFPGDEFGKYSIVSLLGVGGMGHVYLAEDPGLRRKVALKLLPTIYTRDAWRLRRFEQEAQSASALNHPNILTVHEFGNADGNIFIATEYVEGETLRERLTRGPMSLPEVIEIALQIAGALATAHKVGIVHRDIKPENIMLRQDGYVKVLDFGLAKLLDDNSAYQRPLTEIGDTFQSSGLLLGTAKYMSPEQARGEHVDHRSDIFSLGVVFHEMVAGRRPFAGASTKDVLGSIIEDECPPIDGCPEDVGIVVQKSLRKSKEDRYQTIESLISDLRDINKEPILDRAPAYRQFMAPVRHHKMLAVGLLCILAIMAAGILGLKRLASSSRDNSARWASSFLTTTGHAMDPAISKDGKFIAYRAEEAGLVHLRLRDLTTGKETQITSPDKQFVFDPVFTPDSKYLYYEAIAVDPPADYPGRGFPRNYWRELYRRPLDGGPAERVLDYVTSKVTFSPDGARMAFIRADLRQRVGSLVSSDIDGGDQITLLERKAPNGFKDFYSSGPSWSPDGHSLVYVASEVADGFYRIFEFDLRSGTERPLTKDKWDHGVDSPVWLPDGSGIVFVASKTSMASAIWELSYPGLTVHQITGDAGKYMTIGASADNVVIADTVADYINIWIAPNGDRTLARPVMPARHDSRYGLAWAPGDRVVFSRETSGNSDIWIANLDGSDQRQLTTDTGRDQQPVATSDGRYVVFQSNRSGKDHIWRMDIDGSNQQQLTFGVSDRYPTVSPDTNWVIYAALGSDKRTIWKVPIGGGPAEKVFDEECGLSRFSHDGKTVACSAVGNVVVLISFDNGQIIKTVNLPEGTWWDGSWTPDDRAIRYGVTDADANWGLYGTHNWWMQPIDGGPPTQITNFKPGDPASTTTLRSDWSPDGKDLLYNHFEIKSDIVLMKNGE